MTAFNNTIRSWFSLASNTLIIWAGGILVFQYLQQKQSDDNNDKNVRYISRFIDFR